MLFNRDDESPEMLQETYTGLPSEEMGLVYPLKYSARDGQKIPAFMTTLHNFLRRGAMAFCR